MSIGDRIPGARRRWGLVGLGVAAWGGVVAGTYAVERAGLRLDRDAVRIGDRPDDPLHRLAFEGIRQPPTVGAGASTIGPDEEVIGVEVGGRARAYRLGALRDRPDHVVNDLLGGSAVTVTYCDLSDCVRAYTDPARPGPLGVSVAGLYRGREMVLGLGGALYLQDSGAALGPPGGPGVIPLRRLAPERTTWADWRRRHPATDAYEGRPRPKSEGPRPAPVEAPARPGRDPTGDQ